MINLCSRCRWRNWEEGKGTASWCCSFTSSKFGNMWEGCNWKDCMSQWICPCHGIAATSPSIITSVHTSTSPSITPCNCGGATSTTPSWPPCSEKATSRSCWGFTSGKYTFYKSNLHLNVFLMQLLWIAVALRIGSMMSWFSGIFIWIENIVFLIW